jgi:hypothetical protein
VGVCVRCPSLCTIERGFVMCPSGCGASEPRVPLDRVLSLGDTEALQTGDMHSAFRHFSCFIIWGAPHTRLVVGTGLNDERCGVVVQGVAVGEGAQSHEYETAQGAQARHGGCQGA